MKRNPVLLCTIVLFVAVGGMRCDFINKAMEQPPTTKEKMLGIWEVTGATDENGVSILKDINFPVTAIHLSDLNNLASTAGPMFMAIVYGRSKFVSISAKIDQVFQYASLTLTYGRWFIEGGYPDRFTVEVALGVPAWGTLSSILNSLGITQNNYDVTLYHKFMDVKVTFDDYSDSTMTWEFDNTTTATYNTTDKYGNYIIWNGWPTNSFGHYTFKLTKRIETIEQMILQKK